MICPKCQSAELDTSGTCPACGINTKEEIPPATPTQEEKKSESHSGPTEEKNVPALILKQGEKDSGSYSGLIEINYSGPLETRTTESPELPQWRQDLARRLQEIRLKRDPGESSATAEGQPTSIPVPEAGQVAKTEKTTVTSSMASNMRTTRRIPRVMKAVPPPRVSGGPERPTLKPAQPERPGDLPLFPSNDHAAGNHAVPVEAAVPKSSSSAERDLANIQGLIDSIIAKNAGAENPAEVNQPPAVVRRPPPVPLEDRLILVSRTLSGLVDLMVVVLCAGAFIIATDMTSGIDIFDGRSLVVYFLLLCAVFLVYSIFFLATASQTVGMMLTDLKVVSSGEKRPYLRQIVWRCVAYLGSLLPLGAGLLWGCFDRQCRCLHDRLSDTHVSRL